MAGPLFKCLNGRRLAVSGDGTSPHVDLIYARLDGLRVGLVRTGMLQSTKFTVLQVDAQAG